MCKHLCSHINIFLMRGIAELQGVLMFNFRYSQMFFKHGIPINTAISNGVRIPWAPPCQLSVIFTLTVLVVCRSISSALNQILKAFGIMSCCGDTVF